MAKAIVTPVDTVSKPYLLHSSCAFAAAYLSFTPQTELNEAMVSQCIEWAIEKKIEGLRWGNYGYEKNELEFRVLNETLKKSRNKLDIPWWLNHEELRFNKKKAVNDPALNDSLVEEGDLSAITRKIIWLAFGLYGYDKDLNAAIELTKKFQLHIYQ